ncbi:hypothetical protein [Agreia sp. COWG]|uniref:hypothetical protein n=1 Tax=Agreia sp. COWG TaxID=2773266 RepID=UPI001925A5B4|nr:hypothetical protein [Agreia sp. COWG]CAD6016136.1 conserved protein of unknown function [Agreia sp. COWG]
MKPHTLAPVAGERPAVSQDPVVLYDVMRESATRLIGTLLGRVPQGAPADVLERAQLLADDVEDAALAVDVDDVDAMITTTTRFKTERDLILGR